MWHYLKETNIQFIIWPVILEFLHVKPGKGAAFVRTKIRNFITGNTIDKTFRAGSPVVFFILFLFLNTTLLRVCIASGKFYTSNCCAKKKNFLINSAVATDQIYVLKLGDIFYINCTSLCSLFPYVSSFVLPAPRSKCKQGNEAVYV